MQQSPPMSVDSSTARKERCGAFRFHPRLSRSCKNTFQNSESPMTEDSYGPVEVAFSATLTQTRSPSPEPWPNARAKSSRRWWIALTRWGMLRSRSGLSGGPTTDVAERSGHSVEVLLRVCAECLDGGEALANGRISAALRTTRERHDLDKSCLPARLRTAHAAEEEAPVGGHRNLSAAGHGRLSGTGQFVTLSEVRPGTGSRVRSKLNRVLREIAHSSAEFGDRTYNVTEARVHSPNQRREISCPNQQLSSFFVKKWLPNRTRAMS
jgi:hypothetical protein